jgi:hypothetical protein
VTRNSRIAAAFVLVLAVLAVGCSGEEEPAGERLRPLLLAEQVSMVTRAGSGHLVSWAGVLRNPNPWHFGEHAEAMIIARDASGKEIARARQSLDAVPPAGTLPFAGEAAVSGRPAKVTVEFRPARWRRAARIPSAYQPFPVGDLVTQRLDTGAYLVTGYVTAPYRRAVRSLAVTTLLRGADGRLVGGATTSVDDVRPGVRRRFVVTVERVRQPVKRTQAYAGTWGSTSKEYNELALGGALPVHTVKPTTPPFAEDRGVRVLRSDHRP